MAEVETSIVIRAFNEERHLPGLLGAIQRQDYRDFEVIVVDSGSCDRTPEIVTESGACLVRIARGQFTFGYSLNSGIRQSRGRLIAIVSAHTLPVDSSWLRRLIARLRDPSVAMVYGRQIGTDTSKFSEFQDFERTFGNECRVSSPFKVFANNANSAVRKGLWEQHPFDEALPGLEDVAWAKHWRERNFQVVYEPCAAIFHFHNETWRQVRRRYYREAVSAKWIGIKNRTHIPLEMMREGKYLASDLLRAARQRCLTSKADEIVRFRFHKTVGTVHGILDGAAISDPQRRDEIFFDKCYEAVSVRTPSRTSPADAKRRLAIALPQHAADAQILGARPKVSVLMCVYNDERFVGLAIESILAQTCQDFEFVIVNDGSTDGTAEVVASYARADARIRVFAQANAGTTAAANFGLSQCRGTYVARLDSDDISLPHRLEVEADFLDRHPEVALVGGGTEIIDSQGQTIGIRNIRCSRPWKTLRHRCIYQQSDVMFRREVALALGGYREKFHNAQDYDLWLRISEVAKIAKLTNILGQWRLNGGGYTLGRAAEQISEFRMIQRFAAQRRRRGIDEYDVFAPPEPEAHRKPISTSHYDLHVGCALLQALRLKEARIWIKSCLPTNSTTYVRLLFLLTFLPRAVVSLVFSFRNAYLNNFN